MMTQKVKRYLNVINIIKQLIGLKPTTKHDLRLKSEEGFKVGL